GRTMWEKLANVNEATLATYLKNEYPQTVAVVLSKLKPDHAARVLGELPEELAVECVMRMLQAEPVRKEVLANYLKNEYPQTVAVVLSKVKAEHAARVLASLPEDFALECVTRMLRMEPVQREILDKIEQTLRTEFMSNLARTSKRDSHEMMAEIFNNFDRQTEARFIAALEERNRDSAERIRALMFVFEDLGKLDPGGVQTLLRAVDKDQLALALKGASDGLREMFFSNMSERAAKIMREDMETMGPVRLRDVDQAQVAMVQVAKDLAAKGEIMLAGQGGDDELIY
ncbi:MAG: flagellar motor switch protein FliG, partial [Caulobacter sp.]